jgi:hypothetical protein
MRRGREGGRLTMRREREGGREGGREFDKDGERRKHLTQTTAPPINCSTNLLGKKLNIANSR